MKLIELNLNPELNKDGFRKYAIVKRNFMFQLKFLNIELYSETGIVEFDSFENLGYSATSGVHTFNGICKLFYRLNQPLKYKIITQNDINLGLTTITNNSQSSIDSIVKLCLTGK